MPHVLRHRKTSVTQSLLLLLEAESNVLVQYNILILPNITTWYLYKRIYLRKKQYHNFILKIWYTLYDSFFSFDYIRQFKEV